MKSLSTLIFLAAFLFCSNLDAQVDRWQMAAEYVMDIDMDVAKHQYKGKQKLTLFNNSPDDLNKVYYHLFFNAFQPGSMMDVRSRTIKDPDSRVADRISKLTKEEIGSIQVTSLTLDGQATKFDHVGTILEVNLPKSIPSGDKAVLEMEWDAQVPVQIRRSGRNNKEDIDYSMAQWFPKMCEYDYQGWHANPYVGREFYGIWADYSVTIHIDKSYVVGGTGVLKNADQVGMGYESGRFAVPAPDGPKQTWQFEAEDVHDFVWSADPDYTHVVHKGKAGPTMHFLYQKNESTEAWSRLPEIMEEAFRFINAKYGAYPYPQYSFLQGGDGGMEYPMATLITGHRSLGSLVGVSVHELMHSWYQMILGTNEALYPWMDEGFTSFTSNEVMNHLARKGLLPGREAVPDPHAGTVKGFARFATSGAEEPLSTHSDHYTTNQAYGVGSYVKGSVFLQQLKYIIGEKAFDQGMLDYFNTWKFKHPNANDFIRVMERASGIELDWYREYMVNTTHTIDYEVGKLTAGEKKTSQVLLNRVGSFPMPVDVEVTLTDDSKTVYNIPLRIMRGAKPQQDPEAAYIVAEDWPWTNPEYTLKLPYKLKKIKAIKIDPRGMISDVDPENNFSKELQ
ncbi:MAG: M1 family metallopeptidase [Saprospiraceae bacterium]|nr:M1 family metallopeptidase [Saprospiraceae bacterium]